ncbi:MAG TPA: hydroxysqualene dehydroxylase HpnE [Phycisphaerales bacterium]
MSGRRVDHVLVLGGGIAGIAAALSLSQRGVRVTLVESRDRLGGRASSFFDVKTGLWLDNCQHVTLGCCSNYIRLCRMLGVHHLIRWDDEQYWVEAGGRTSVLKPSWLPAPAHGLPSFALAKFLTLAEKARIGAALAQMRFLDRSRYTDRTFTSLLDELDQEPSECRKFWDPIIISACNLLPDHACAAAALQVFQDGFLKGAEAIRIGIMTVPLGEVYRPATAAIEAGGGRVILGEYVARFDAHRVELANGQTLRADAVICALPFEKARDVVDPAVSAGDERFAPLADMRHSPILGVHLFFDRPVLPLPHAVLVERDTQWLFRKDVDGRVVHAVISAADAWLDLDTEAIAKRVVGDLNACFPGAVGADLTLARPVKERRATFAYTPGFDAIRPGVSAADGGGPFLAGDYTQTGWPATMEGAAISGFAAAEAVQCSRR